MSDGSIDEIKARLNIVEFIGSYVRLEKSGAHWKACCPFHQERTPSFMVNEEKNMWHCFGCGKGGDIFAFVMEIESLEFREALQMLAERAGVELPRYKGGTQEKGDEKERLYELLELATKFFEKQLWDGAGKQAMLPYIHGRGLTDESIKTFRLGYAPNGWRHLMDFLEERGFHLEEIERTGLILKKEGGRGYYDRFRDRIIFPIFDILGRVIGYSARVAPGGDETQAKYINTPETVLYHKSRVLYGLYQAKKAMKQLSATIIVEGNMDVIAMHQAGIKNTIAVSGTALTVEQLTIMKRYGNEVRLFFDMDGAGQKAARKSAELALEKEMLVSVIALPSGKDAADMGQNTPEQLQAVVENALPAPQYFLNALIIQYDPTSADGKRHIVDDYITLLLFIKNPIEQAHWVKILAQVVQTDEKVITDVLHSAVSTHERRERTSMDERENKKAFNKTFSFGRRSEVLREELVGLMYVDNQVRHFIQALPDTETRRFIEQHPLFFFAIQAGERDPLPLIEDTYLKSDATRLMFRLLEAPDFMNVAEEDRSQKMLDIAKKYWEDLRIEITKREKLLSLERMIDEARTHKDREREKQLVAEFTAISLDKF